MLTVNIAAAAEETSSIGKADKAHIQVDSQMTCRTCNTCREVKHKSASLHCTHVHGPVQDVSGGKPVQVADSDLWGMEIDVAAAAEEIRNIGKADKGKGVDDFLSGVGLGAFADQLKDLRLSKSFAVPQ